MPIGNDFGQRPSQLSPLTELDVADIFTVTKGGTTYRMLASMLRSFIRKGDVGLANADNTSDMNKPVSTATLAQFASVNSQISTILTNLASLDSAKATVSSVSALDARLTAVETSKANQTALDSVIASVSALSAQKLNITDYTDQTSAIAGKASVSSVLALDTRVTDLESGKANLSTVTALSTVVNSKANQTDLDAANLVIATKANQASVNALDTTVSGHTASIGSLNVAVSAKASQTDVNALTTRVTAAENDKANATDLATLQTTVSGISSSLGTVQTQTSSNSTAISGLQSQLSGLNIPVNIPEWAMSLGTTSDTINVNLNFDKCNGYNMSTVTLKVGHRLNGSSGAYTFLPEVPFVNGTLTYSVAVTGLNSEETYQIQALLTDSNSSLGTIVGTTISNTATTTA